MEAGDLLEVEELEKKKADIRRKVAEAKKKQQQDEKQQNRVKAEENLLEKKRLAAALLHQPEPPQQTQQTVQYNFDDPKHDHTKFAMHFEKAGDKRAAMHAFESEVRFR
jgi:hypothetical protein